MIPFLIATSFTCQEAEDLVFKMKPSLGDEIRSELVQVVKNEAPEDCWDAND